MFRNRWFRDTLLSRHYLSRGWVRWVRHLALKVEKRPPEPKGFTHLPIPFRLPGPDPRPSQQHVPHEKCVMHAAAVDACYVANLQCQTKLKKLKKKYFQIDRGGRAIYLKVMVFFSFFCSFFCFFSFFSLSVFSVPPSSRDLLKLCGYRRENEHVSKQGGNGKKTGHTDASSRFDILQHFQNLAKNKGSQRYFL